MSYEIEHCITQWEQAKSASPIGNSYEENIIEWTKFWDYLSQEYDNRNGDQLFEQICKFLLSVLSVKNKSVLDVGCGTGKYTLCFLEKKTKRVDCIDNSTGMLNKLKEKTASFSNKVHIFQSTFNNFKEPHKYDIVFSSMSPAVSSYKDIDKMESLSNDLCCHITYANSCFSSTRAEIWYALRNVRFHSNMFDVIHPFNYLYAKGRNPNIRIFTKKFETQIPVSDAVVANEKYFSIFNTLSDRDKNIINSVLIEKARDGIIYENYKQPLAVLWWSVRS